MSKSMCYLDVSGVKGLKTILEVLDKLDTVAVRTN